MIDGLKIEKGEVEKKVTTTYTVKSKITFSQEDLEDSTTYTLTKRELFNFLGKNQDAEGN